MFVLGIIWLLRNTNTTHSSSTRTVFHWGYQAIIKWFCLWLNTLGHWGFISNHLQADKHEGQRISLNDE